MSKETTGGENPKSLTFPIAQATAPAVLVVETLITKALEKGVSVDILERMFALWKERRAEAAKEAFFADMALAQSEMPVIERKTPGGKTNAGDKPAYYYAQLGDIAKAVQPIIHKYGFSYSIKAEAKETGVKATCLVTHKFGHTEESTVEFPMATKTNIMSAPQVVAATMTFAKRYAFCNAFGIMTAEEDREELLEARQRNTEEYAFRMARESIEDAKDKELADKISFLEGELKLATEFEAGTGRQAPKLGLKASQYQSLLAIAKARSAGKSEVVGKPEYSADPGRDDAGFHASQNG